MYTCIHMYLSLHITEFDSLRSIGPLQTSSYAGVCGDLNVMTFGVITKTEPFATSSRFLGDGKCSQKPKTFKLNCKKMETFSFRG